MRHAARAGERGHRARSGGAALAVTRHARRAPPVPPRSRPPSRSASRSPAASRPRRIPARCPRRRPARPPTPTPTLPRHRRPPVRRRCCSRRAASRWSPQGLAGAVVDPRAARRRGARERTRHRERRRGAGRRVAARRGDRARASSPAARAGCSGSRSCPSDGERPDYVYAYFTAASDNRIVRMPLTGAPGSLGARRSRGRAHRHPQGGQPQRRTHRVRPRRLPLRDRRRRRQPRRRAGPGLAVGQDPADDAGRAPGARQPVRQPHVVVRAPQPAGPRVGRRAATSGPRSSARTRGTS